MPLVLSRTGDTAKMDYLKALFSKVYLRDIVERKKVRREDVLSAVMDLLCSSAGSLTNPSRIADSLNSRLRLTGDAAVSANTVTSYISHLTDAYLFEECRRLDVRGKNYFDYPNKYYCSYVGLRNARIDFRQQEMMHLMENILYNDLRIRGCSVDVGVVYGSKRNASVETEAKAAAENKPLFLARDSFPKIIVRHDIRKRWYDDNGILHIGVIDFLLDEALI